MKKILVTGSVVPIMMLASIPLAAQDMPSAQTSGQAPVSYASVSQVNAMLSELQQAAQSSIADLDKLRVDRWKTDSSSKRQAQADVGSLLRNLQSALPAMINDLQAAPEDLSVTFKLYHNLDALHDVLRSVAETAGAFGPRDEYQPLANDANAIDNVRRALADRVQNLAASKESELARLRAEVKAAQAAPQPVKKIVVDDTEPPKKTPKKKASPKPGNPASSTPSMPPAPQ